MPDQAEPQLESYQFSEYMGTSSAIEPGQAWPPAGSIQPPQIPPMAMHSQGQPMPIPSAPYPPYPPPGYGYPPAYYPMPLIQAAPRPKKPIYFPLTRNASVGKQAVSMAIYSVLMTVFFAGNTFLIAITQANQMPGNIFVHPDGTANGLLVLLLSVFLLLTLPATTLLSGAFFGAARASLATFIVVGSTTSLWLVYALLQHISININFNSPICIAFLLLPLTAALVGFFYDRRRCAAWWKSFLTLLLGSAFFVTVWLTFGIIFGRPTDTSALTGFYIGIGCIWVLLIPLMTLPIAGIEGIIHAVLAARSNKNQ